MVCLALWVTKNQSAGTLKTVSKCGSLMVTSWCSVGTPAWMRLEGRKPLRKTIDDIEYLRVLTGRKTRKLATIQQRSSEDG